MKQQLIEALQSVPLNISSTRREGNGLRNADEVADALMPVILADLKCPDMVEAVAKSIDAGMGDLISTPERMERARTMRDKATKSYAEAALAAVAKKLGE